MEVSEVEKKEKAEGELTAPYLILHSWNVGGRIETVADTFLGVFLKTSPSRFSLPRSSSVHATAHHPVQIAGSPNRHVITATSKSTSLHRQKHASFLFLVPPRLHFRPPHLFGTLRQPDFPNPHFTLPALYSPMPKRKGFIHSNLFINFPTS